MVEETAQRRLAADIGKGEQSWFFAGWQPAERLVVQGLRQTAVEEPSGHTAHTDYDAAGNVTQTTDYANGNTLSVTDPDGNVTQYQYDQDGRQTLMISPTGARTTASYDNAGNISTVVVGDNRTTTYSYDQDNRETGETWRNSSGVTTDVLTFTYDYAGQMLTAANSVGTVTLGYNANGQTSAQLDVFGLTTNYSYDGNGNLTERTDSLGGTTDYTFDGTIHLASVQFSGTGPSPVSAVLTYTADNQLSSLTRYDSLTESPSNVVGTTTYGYDNADRVTAITTKDSTSTTLAYYNYTYDNANRVSVLTTKSGWAETFVKVHTPGNNDGVGRSAR